MQQAEQAHFQRVIDYIRERRESEVSLTDVVALAEITAAGADFEVVARIFVCPTEDADYARNIGRRMIAAYLTVPAYAEFHRWLGREPVLAAMWRAWGAGPEGVNGAGRLPLLQTQVVPGPKGPQGSPTPGRRGPGRPLSFAQDRPHTKNATVCPPARRGTRPASSSLHASLASPQTTPSVPAISTAAARVLHSTSLSAIPSLILNQE